MTLLQPDHPAAYYPNLKKHKAVYGTVMGGLTPVQKDLLNTFLVQTIPARLIEKETPTLVRNLTRKGIKTFAFTATLTGKFSRHEERVIHIREDQLRKMGFDFSVQWMQFPSLISFTHFKEHAGSYPMFYHGVLSSNGEHNPNKGETLGAFLKEMLLADLKPEVKGELPKVVILVDDRIKNLVCVKEHLKAHHPSIHFIGIEYRGAFSYTSKDISKDDFRNFWEDLSKVAKSEGYE